MRHERLRLRVQDWLASSAAGIFATGSSGAGKSEFLRLLVNSLAPTGQAIFLLDPAGDLVADIERDLALAPQKIRERVVILKPFDLARGLAGPNPLAVYPDQDPLRRAAMLATKVKHMARILLNTWGETDFVGKPLMFKWVTRFLHLLALAQLPVSAVRYFFDPSHPVYAALTRVAPDFVTQLELEELSEMRPRDRAEFIASSQNRFLGLLANPAIEKNLSITTGALDVRQLARDRKIVLLSLAKEGGICDDDDVAIMANLYLMEIVFAVSNIPRPERQPLTVLVDELPIFATSFPLLESFLPLTRKYLARWVLSAQGAFVFPDGPQDKLFNLALGQCGSQVVFSHGNWQDCDFFSKQLAGRHYDPYRRKHTLVTPVQIQTGRELVELFDESTSWSDADQKGGAKSTGETTTSTTTQQDGVTETDLAPGEVGEGQRSTRSGHSTADASGETTTTGTNWANTHTTGGSRTKKQSLVPILETREIEHITFMSPDEQLLELAGQIAEFSPGEAILRRRGVGTSLVRFPLLPAAGRTTPRYAAKKIAELDALVTQLPCFQSVSAIDAHNHQLAEQLLSKMTYRQTTARPAARLALPQPAPDEEVGF